MYTYTHTYMQAASEMESLIQELLGGTMCGSGFGIQGFGM